MPYYKEVNLLFIHIPKTGGSSFEEYLKSKYTQILHSTGGNKNFSDQQLAKVSFQHQKYSTLYKYKDLFGIDFDHPNLKIITIVRNPYDRIISDLFFYKLIQKNSTPEEVFEIIKKYIIDDKYDNHNIPQYEFLVDENNNIVKKIHIFRTETLTQDIINCGLKDYIFFSNENKKNYDIYLNSDSISLINNFYEKDFEFFNYNKK